MLLKEGMSLSDLFSDSNVNTDDVDVPMSEEEVTLLEILDGRLDFGDLQSNEKDIIYSVAGYVTSFVSCQCFQPPASTSLLVDTSHFDSLNRGGWTHPQETILFTCSAATVAFAVLTSEENRKKFLSFRHHRRTFCKILHHLLIRDIPSSEACTHLKRVLYIIFNCLSKNFLRNIDCQVFTASSFKKIHKLVSGTAK